MRVNERAFSCRCVMKLSVVECTSELIVACDETINGR